MRILVIGSGAFEFGRPLKDIDIVATYDDFIAYTKSFSGKIEALYPSNNGNKMICILRNPNKDQLIIEGDIAWPGTNSEKLLELLSDFNPDDTIIFAPPPVLYMLKMSHRFKKNSPHFNKTMDDIIFLRKCDVIKEGEENGYDSPEWLRWYNQRVEETYNYSHPKLNVEKDDFFKADGVTYVYDHDWIHTVMSTLTQGPDKPPAYTNYMSDNKSVLSSRQKFEACSPSIQLYGVMEEALVLALERSQIPSNYTVNPHKSFTIALEKVCTSITSGWFRAFAWENYYTVLEKYPSNYSDFFQENVKKGFYKLYKA